MLARLFGRFNMPEDDRFKIQNMGYGNLLANQDVSMAEGFDNDDFYTLLSMSMLANPKHNEEFRSKNPDLVQTMVDYVEHNSNRALGKIKEKNKRTVDIGKAYARRVSHSQNKLGRTIGKEFAKALKNSKRTNQKKPFPAPKGGHQPTKEELAFIEEED